MNTDNKAENFLGPFKTVPNEKAIPKTPFQCEEIALITGKLGGGKSMFCLVKFIWPELINGERTIVTNMRLNLPALREAIQLYSERDGSEVFDRVRIVEDDTMQQFWLHRGREINGEWWDAKDVAVTEKGRGENQIRDYLPTHPHYHKDKGVMYIYDEAHKGFRARDWMSFGRTGEWYLNLIRHCGDTVILASPHPSQIDKYLRNLMQKVYVTRNGKKEKFLKFFKGPCRFFWTQYEGPYSDTNMMASASGTYRLEPWIANCYNTSCFGGDADTKKQVTGIPFIVFPLILVVVAIIIAIAPVCLGKGSGYWLSKMYPEVKRAEKVTQRNSGPTQEQIVEAVKAREQKPTLEPEKAPAPKKRLHYFAVVGNVEDCSFLSDDVDRKGEIIHGQMVSRNTVKDDEGEIYHYQMRERRAVETNNVQLNFEPPVETNDVPVGTGSRPPVGKPTLTLGSLKKR